jgi:hypothetical protein
MTPIVAEAPPGAETRAAIAAALIPADLLPASVDRADLAAVTLALMRGGLLASEFADVLDRAIFLALQPQEEPD